MNQERFKNKTAVITGGASGIGEAIARRLAAEGAEIILFDRNQGAAAAIAEQLSCRALPVDVSQSESVREALEAQPRVDILINSAGIAHIGNVETTQPEDLDRLYGVNVKGVYLTMHFALPKMLAQGRGVILNIASVASKIGIADRFGYSMTKGAVLTMTLSVARDYVSRNIRCNCICPARVHTPFVDGYLADKYPGQEAEMLKMLSAYQPIGRMGKPCEIAALAAFLCSEEASFITGSAYDIDGGVTLLR